MLKPRRNVSRILRLPDWSKKKKELHKWHWKKRNDKSRKMRRPSSMMTLRIEKKESSMRKLVRRKMRLSTRCSMIRCRSRRPSMSRIRMVSETSSLNARSSESINWNKRINLSLKNGLPKKPKIQTRVRKGRRIITVSLNPSKTTKRSSKEVTRPLRDSGNKKRIKLPRLVVRKRCTKWSRISSKRKSKVCSANNF